MRAEGPALEIVSLTATTPGGGQLSGQGTVNLARGIETDLKIQARNATVIDTDLATAIIDSDLAIVGNLQSDLKLSGKVTVVRADIRVPDNLPPSVQEIEVVEVNASPQVAARIAARNRRRSRPRSSVWTSRSRRRSRSGCAAAAWMSSWAAPSISAAPPTSQTSTARSSCGTARSTSSASAWSSRKAS